MKNLIYKEFRLATPCLTILFLLFTLMTFIPGYPILCGAFFVCFGIFQGYQYSREAGDIMYSVLLPIRKTDVVKAKYLSVIILQMTAFLLFGIFTFIRMTWMSETEVYVNNVLMGANWIFLAFVLMTFGLFNWVFLGGFFKTAYYYGKPFVTYIILNFLFIALAETLHHIPGLEWMNSLGYENAGKQLVVLGSAAVIYALVTSISCKKSQKRFDILDL